VDEQLQVTCLGDCHLSTWTPLSGVAGETSQNRTIKVEEIALKAAASASGITPKEKAILTFPSLDDRPRERSKGDRSRDLNPANTPTSVATTINASAATSFVSRTGATMSTPNPPRKLRGSEPGLLDATQPSRLLRDPASKLYFASFDPFLARQDDGADRMRNLSLHEKLYRPKRVVVEMTPTGSFWRFVPRATTDDGLKNEERWPRIVDICG